jgi:sodium-dependent dicarboxylate transporter 2/3/5
VAFATSFAHFLIVGTPNNAIVYGLGIYPDTGDRMIHPLDFVKYGFILFLLSMAVVWIVGFIIIYNVVGFPEGILETARGVLEAGAQ